MNRLIEEARSYIDYSEEERTLNDHRRFVDVEYDATEFNELLEGFDTDNIDILLDEWNNYVSEKGTSEILKVHRDVLESVDGIDTKKEELFYPLNTDLYFTVSNDFKNIRAFEKLSEKELHERFGDVDIVEEASNTLESVYKHADVIFLLKYQPTDKIGISLRYEGLKRDELSKVRDSDIRKINPEKFRHVRVGKYSPILITSITVPTAAFEETYDKLKTLGFNISPDSLEKAKDWVVRYIPEKRVEMFGA